MRSEDDFLPTLRPRRRWPVPALLVGVALAASVVAATDGPSHVNTVSEAVAATRAADQPERQGRLARSVGLLQDRLRRLPGDASAWADLGGAYVELARVTADPTYYVKAQGALDTSLRLRPDDNGAAMIGMGALANARHDFTAARDWALRAQSVRPDAAEVYGVLADALTQLGDDPGATAAVQRMLDLRPNVAAFARASYHFELHGMQSQARETMHQALESSSAPDEIAFCRYYLGELAFNAGRLAEASDQYELGLAAAGQDPALLQGRAKVAAARGDLPSALAGYRQVVSRAPVPQYLLEYAELLVVAGRQAEADQQFLVLAQQQRLLESQGAADDLTAALIAADHGDRAEALRRAQAEWARRENVLVADALAWALHVNGRSAEALGFAEKAAGLGWRNATFAYHRGMILAALGRAREAEQALDEALRINPAFSVLHAPRARQALAGLRSGR